MTFLLLVVVAYVALGVFFAARFARRGQPGAAASALFAWPLLVADGGEASTKTRPAGPFAQPITRGVGALREALAEPDVRGLVPEEHVVAVEAALRAADARLSRVDRLLADADVQASAAGARLVAGRTRAADEIESVLGHLVQLRVQLGLVALEGDAAPVRDQLAALVARLGALDELHPG